MKAFALALLLAFPVWAEPRTVLEVREGTVTTPAGEVVPVTGGAYLDAPSLLATGKELAALRAENAALKEAAAVTPPALIGVAVVALVLGFAGGIYVAVKIH